MKPTMGQMVIVRGIRSNGGVEHPAAVNAVFEGRGYADGREFSVNLTIFPDCGAVQSQTSVPFFSDRASAVLWIQANGESMLAAFPRDGQFQWNEKAKLGA